MERLILDIFPPYSTTAHRVVVSSARALIGRGYHCDVILDDPYVSAEHIEVTLSDNGQFLIADKGSVNGVFIGATRVSDVPVRFNSGEEIKIGRTRIKVFTPCHAIHPVREHNRLSSIFKFFDRPVVGVLFSVICTALILFQAALVESADIDFWKDSAPGIWTGSFLFIWITWSLTHLMLVIKNKKSMPWPRIVSYIAVATSIFAFLGMLILPYMDFYLLSPVPTLIFTAVALSAFLLFYDYFFQVVCELPVRSVRSMLYLAATAVAVISMMSIDMDYNSDPGFPETIVTADLPLPSVQPLDGFIEQALGSGGK